MLMFKVTLGDKVWYGVDSNAPPPNDVFEVKSYCYRSYVRFLQGKKKIYNNFVDQPYKQWFDFIIEPGCTFEVIYNDEEMGKNPPMEYEKQNEHLKNLKNNLALARSKLTQNRNQKYYSTHGPPERPKKTATEKYHEINKNKLNEKFICDCGGCYTRRNKAVHMRSKKHLEHSSD